MRSVRKSVVILVSAMCLGASLSAQQAVKTPPQSQRAPQTTAALLAAQDTDLKPEGLDRVISAVYDLISGPAGQERDPDKFRSLFVKDFARLAVVAHDPKTSQDRLIVMSTDDFISRSFPKMKESGFYEREVARRTERFGNIIHVWSTYESRHQPQEKPFQRGINSFELVNDGSGWKVLTILWQGERPDSPIPQQYLSSHP